MKKWNKKYDGHVCTYISEMKKSLLIEILQK